MGRYLYTVQDAQGLVTAGDVVSDDENGAVEYLQGRGFFILSIKEEDARGSSLAGMVKFMRGGITGREMVFFGEQLSTLIAGGLPLLRALSLLSEHMENKELSLVVSSLIRDVSAGDALHKAMQKHPGVFDEVWVFLVQAGEISGQLPAVLRQVTAYTEAKENVKSRVVTALAYPAALMLLSISVLVYFIVYIMPVFAGIFRDFNLELPLITRLLVGVSDIAGNYAPMLVVLLTGGALALKLYIAVPVGRKTWNRVQFNLPLFGGLIRSIQLERLLTTLSTLVRSGVSILSSLSVLEGVFNKNLIFQDALKEARDKITAGGSISDSFGKSGVFPAMVTDMMRIGEESGKLPDMIDVLSKYYREQVDQFLRRFSSMIDPILVVGVGGIVAVILISIFMPIFQLSNIGGG